MYHITTSKEMGRELTASHDIKAGTVVTRCEILLLNENDTITLNQITDLKCYTFTFDSNRDCLVLGDGELFNHSSKPNVGYTLTQYENRSVMVFVSTRDIKAGEQLFIDYAADVSEIDIDKYSVNLI